MDIQLPSLPCQHQNKVCKSLYDKAFYTALSHLPLSNWYDIAFSIRQALYQHNTTMLPDTPC